MLKNIVTGGFSEWARATILFFIAPAIMLGAAELAKAGSVVTYIGSDEGVSSDFSGSNSDAAAANFRTAANALGPITSIDFESQPLGLVSLNPGIATGVSLSTTNAGTAYSNTAPLNSDFGFNTTPSGQNYVNIATGDLTVNFSPGGVQAFGAYFSGIQVSGETITFSDGTTQTVAAPFLLNGGLAFIGFTDAGTSIASVTYHALTDSVGMDDLQFVPAPTTAATPEPASMTLLGIGIAGIAGYGWRRRRVTAG